MRNVSISVTEASRNFAECINRARYQGTTFLLHKNGVAVARIVPERKVQAEEGPEPPLAEEPVAGDGQQQSQTAETGPKPKRRDIW